MQQAILLYMDPRDLQHHHGAVCEPDPFKLFLSLIKAICHPEMNNRFMGLLDEEIAYSENKTWFKAGNKMLLKEIQVSEMINEQYPLIGAEGGRKWAGE